MEHIITLIEQSRSGDREAFARIVRQYQGMVSAATLNVVGNYAQSEDLAQETFLTAWKKLPELREPEKLASWLYGIARRVALRWLEQQQRNPLRNYAELNTAELDADSMTDQQVQVEAEELHQREQSLALVWSTVKELPETLREPLLLYYRYSKTVADIAATLELTEEAVRQRLSRGRKMLKAEVEKQVETILEATGPGEYFTVGVLAALPILATGNQVLAASSAGAAASQTASAGGASASQSVISGITTFFWTFFVGWILPIIVVGIGVVLGIWSGIRNAPTLRARQLMVKVALGYFIAAHVLFLLIMLLTMGINYAVVNHQLVPDRVPLRNFCVGTHVFLMLTCPIFVIITAYLVNRKWRRIVEEDSATARIERSETGLLSIYIGGGIALFSCLLTFIICASLRQIPLDFFYVVPPAILLFGISLFYYAVRISKDEESFAKSPPRLPNLLSIMTGKEKAPKGFRNRINFWGDLVGIGWGLYVMHVVLFGFYLHYRYRHTESIKLFVEVEGWLEVSVSAFALLLSLVTLVYFLFAIFFAGIPRRRYWGMIFLGASVLLVNFCVHYMASERLSQTHFLELWMIYGLSAWYLLCFTLLGVSGLYVFRKKKSEPAA